MYFAQRTWTRMRIAFVVLASYFALAIALAVFFPRDVSFRQSLIHWLLGLPLFLALWATLEFAGTKLLSLRLWARMHPVLRVTVLVLLVVAVVAAGMWFANGGAGHAP